MSNHCWAGDPVPLPVDPYVPAWTFSMSPVAGLDPNPAHTAALNALATAINRHAEALEKANQLPR